MLGQNLRQLRLEHQLTQRELARLVGIGQTYISELEHNKRSNPSKDVLEKLARVLNVSIDILVEDNNQQLEQLDTDTINKPRLSLTELMEIWSDLNIADKKTLIQTAQSLWERREDQLVAKE